MTLHLHDKNGGVDMDKDAKEFEVESAKNAEGCFWKVLIIVGLIIGAFCFISEKMNDKRGEWEISEIKKHAKNPPPITKQKTVVRHYHRCSVCREEYSEEGGFPNCVVLCDKCNKWHCGGCVCPILDNSNL